MSKLKNGSCHTADALIRLATQGTVVSNLVIDGSSRVGAAVSREVARTLGVSKHVPNLIEGDCNHSTAVFQQAHSISISKVKLNIS